MKPEVLMTNWTTYKCHLGHVHLHGIVHRHPAHGGRVTNGEYAFTSTVVQMGDGFAETLNTMYSLDGQREDRVQHPHGVCP